LGGARRLRERRRLVGEILRPCLFWERRAGLRAIVPHPLSPASILEVECRRHEVGKPIERGGDLESVVVDEPFTVPLV
jgi:hypothetical protein